MSAAPSERLAWAATVVDPRPGERVLEVGCGHGVLADLLASRGAQVTAVDRSATMTAATARRTADRVHVLTGSLVDLDLGGPFDVVVSFDVRAFWTPPAPEWDVVARVWRPAAGSSSASRSWRRVPTPASRPPSPSRRVPAGWW